nr:hypothetical protein [Tanacetum cinerariifolium]
CHKVHSFIIQWHPNENLLKEDVNIVPVWVKLYGVLVMAFSEDSLNTIATKLELKDNIVMAMPKITWEGHYTCNVRVKYEWKPPKCSSCKVFGHIHEECPKNTGAGEKKTRHVPKKHNASYSGNKKKGVEPTIEVSNSNLFEVLNLVDNDVKLEYPSDYDSDYEVASVDNDIARFMASKWAGFGTQSLLEQWKDSYGNGNYDEDPYDDDMYEGQ